MANTNANAAPSANVKPDTKAGPVKLDMKDPSIIGHAAKLTAATEQEVKAREDAAVVVDKAASGTWGVMRDETVTTIKELGPVNAGLVLDVYLLSCKTIGGMAATKATQYAANLRRMVKAATLGKELPAEILTAGRSAYLDHAFWAQSGVLAKTGTKAGSGKTAASKAKAPAAPADGTTAPEGDKQASVGDAITDKATQKIADKLAALKGQFKGRALALIHEALDQQLKLQAAATGTAGQVAAAA
jgi:hypothetical protein